MISVTYGEGFIYSTWRWNHIEIPIMEEWIVKLLKFAEMAKLTCLIKEGATVIFIKDWKYFMDIFNENG